MDKETRKQNRGYRYSSDEEVVTPKIERTPAPKVPTEKERRQSVCAVNNIQWEDSIASLSVIDFDAYVNRRLRIRSKS